MRPTSLGINAAQYSRIKNGDTEKVLSEAQWMSIARRLGVSTDGAIEWKTANTPIFQFVSAQLGICQDRSLSAILCDRSDIGKTFVARQYVKNNRNAVYIDCSQPESKTKTGLVKSIAKEFGLGNAGWYMAVYGEVVSHLKTSQKPLVILDEAGDLDYEALKLVKALWNATEYACGWYMMGADGLRSKMQRGINSETVGYTELFTRFGTRYGKIPTAGRSIEEFLQVSAAMIIKVNAPEGTDVNKVLRATMGEEDGIPSLRRIYKELSKIWLDESRQKSAQVDGDQ
jgi:hypothetical protein